MYQDKTLVCRDCGGEFVFSAGEQEFFALKGLQNEPGRCPSCRSARRSSGGMGGGSRSSGSREMTTSDLLFVRSAGAGSFRAAQRQAGLLQ